MSSTKEIIIPKGWDFKLKVDIDFTYHEKTKEEVITDLETLRYNADHKGMAWTWIDDLIRIIKDK